MIFTRGSRRFRCTFGGQGFFRSGFLCGIPGNGFFLRVEFTLALAPGAIVFALLWLYLGLGLRLGLGFDFRFGLFFLFFVFRVFPFIFPLFSQVF